MLVRPAAATDLADIVEIYNQHVLDGHATFDDAPCTVDERREWFDMFMPSGRHRCLVATDGEDHVVGYACSSPYRSHRSFDHTVELSIYLEPSSVGQGIGSLLYRDLLDLLAVEGVHRFVVGIALPNPASIALHERFGFTQVGVFDEYAIKNGAWVSSIWMQRPGGS